jgi:hypothetical protein
MIVEHERPFGIADLAKGERAGVGGLGLIDHRSQIKVFGRRMAKFARAQLTDEMSPSTIE